MFKSSSFSFKSISDCLLDFLFPASCAVCGKPVSKNGELCPDCWKLFDWISSPKCYKCGYPFPADLDLGDKPLCPVCAAGKSELDFIRSACVYNDISRDVILPFKHSGHISYAKFMSKSMINALQDLNLKPDVVLPVPLSHRRLFHRGYNQAVLLARDIARFYGVALDFDSVKRIHRPDMGHKNAKQRAENIAGVFKILKPHNIKDRNILIVDDVMTTGATLAELYKVLKKGGANKVYGVTFARVVRAI